MNGSLLTIYPKEFENVTLSMLELCGLAVNDSGTYSCQATNSAGNASVEFEIIVLPGN